MITTRPPFRIYLAKRWFLAFCGLVFLANFLLAPAVCRLWEAPGQKKLQDYVLLETLDGETEKVPLSDCGPFGPSEEQGSVTNKDCSFCVINSGFALQTKLPPPFDTPLIGIQNAYGYETPFRLSPELGSLSSRAPPLYT